MQGKTLVISIGAILLLGVGGVVWYVQRPEAVVTRAVHKLGEAKTAKFEVTLELENQAATQQVLGEAGTVEVKLDGVLQRRDEGKDALQAGIVLGTKTESISVNVEGDVRFIDDKAYVFIEKSPPVFQLLALLKGKWLELPRGGESGKSTADVPEELFASVAREGMETINGDSVVKYSAQAREGAVVHMMDSIADILGTKLTEQQINDIKVSAAKVGVVPVEVWVKRWSNDIKQLRAQLAVPGGNTMRFTLKVNSLNEPVQITAPEGAVPVSEAVQNVVQQQAQ